MSYFETIRQFTADFRSGTESQVSVPDRLKFARNTCYGVGSGLGALAVGKEWFADSAQEHASAGFSALAGVVVIELGVLYARNLTAHTASEE